MFSEFVIVAFWKSSFGKGSPRESLRSLSFTSSSDSCFPSFLFIFKLFRLILWSTDAKMPMVPSLHLCLTITTTGGVEIFSLQVQKSSPRISLQRKSRVKHLFLTLFFKLCGRMAPMLGGIVWF